MVLGLGLGLVLGLGLGLVSGYCFFALSCALSRASLYFLFPAPSLQQASVALRAALSEACFVKQLAHVNSEARTAVGYFE